MTRMPGANWTPVVNFTHGGVTRPPRGMVVHTAVSPNTTQALNGVVNYENEPSSQVSSYFVVGIDGTIDQCVDLDDRAWTQAAGNGEWVGVENIGDGTKEPLTDAQVGANARIFAWLHTTYGVPLQRTDDPVGGHGLGWHGMGGQAWGGHLVCPGPYVRAQLDTIVAGATFISNPITPTAAMGGNLMVLFQGDNGTVYSCNGFQLHHLTNSGIEAKMHGAVSAGGGGVPLITGFTTAQLVAEFGNPV